MQSSGDPSEIPTPNISIKIETNHNTEHYHQFGSLAAVVVTIVSVVVVTAMTLLLVVLVVAFVAVAEVAVEGPPWTRTRGYHVAVG